VYYELGQTIQVKLQDAIEATRTLIAIPTELPPAAAPVVTKEALAESEHELMDELLTEPADTAPEQDEA
jgi:exoribonuclease-2